MKSQKKVNSGKKLKSVKSEATFTMPIGALMLEISELKSQLADIKSKKSLNSQKQKDRLKEFLQKSELRPEMNYTPQNLVDQNKTIDKFQRFYQSTGVRSSLERIEPLSEIIFPVREHELKLNIELNKLYREIKNDQSSKSPSASAVIHQLNNIVEYLNQFISDFAERKPQFDNFDNSPRTIIQREMDFKSSLKFEEMLENQQKISASYQLANKQLEKQIIQLRHALAFNEDSSNHKNSELSFMCKDLLAQNQSFQSQIQTLKMDNQILTQQRDEFQQKLQIYEKSIEKKEEQIIILEEDISYNRMEAEKYRNQKKQAEKLYMKLVEDCKSDKNRHEKEIQGLEREKQRWRIECERKKSGEGEIMEITEQKNALKKDLQSMRSQNLRKNSEYNEIKSKLHQQHRKNMSLQGSNYNLTCQNEKLNRAILFYKEEIEAMGREVEDLRRIANRKQNLRRKENKSVEKGEALSEIRQLIQGHRKAVLDEDDQ